LSVRIKENPPQIMLAFFIARNFPYVFFRSLYSFTVYVFSLSFSVPFAFFLLAKVCRDGDGVGTKEKESFFLSSLNIFSKEKRKLLPFITKYIFQGKNKAFEDTFSLLFN
jgi:hypothetical protein